jgi:hypothetical protein
MKALYGFFKPVYGEAKRLLGMKSASAELALILFSLF